MLRTRQAFTLIELLVVISIISVLISMLLPALKAARGAAHSAACQSTHRQVGVATQAYISDYNDHFPSYIGYNSGGTFISWNELYFDRGYYASEFIDCPSVPAGANPQKGAFVGVGYNHHALGHWDFTNNRALTISQGKIDRYGGDKVYAFMDTTSDGTNGFYHVYYAPGASAPHARHINDRVNILYADWHLESIQIEHPDIRGPYPNNPWGTLGWGGPNWATDLYKPGAWY